MGAMKPLAVAVLSLALASPFLLGAAPAPARAVGEDDPVSVDWVSDDAACRCKAGNACWHYLHAPVEPPADPCWCNFCTKVSRHDGSKPLPADWSVTCATNGRMQCFLKRHAASWNLYCSECLEKDDCACKNAHPGDCPRCEKGGSPWDPEKRKDLAYRLKKEQEVFATRDVVIAWSPHFYVVTDIPSLKIPTGPATYRVAGTHELAHIYAERAEKARREFIQNFGDEWGGDLPSAIYLPKRETTGARVQAKYNGSARTNLVYGGSNDGKVADGFCFNGFCTALSGNKSGGDDEGLHHTVRHMIGHIGISCWTKVDGKDRVLPRWLFEGVGHWLAKRHRLLYDRVVWCADEGTSLSGSGDDWAKEARKVAADLKTVPVERLLEKSTIGLLDFDDHVRSWSYVELALKEDREAFLRVCRALRNEVPNRQAWREGMACTPDEWDQRWKDRVLGRRSSFGPLPSDKEGDDGPGAAERRALRNETDMQNLVARIRSIGVCADPKTAAVLTELFARESDAVREVLVVILSKSTEPKVLEAIRVKGLESQVPMVRAYAARALGFANDQGALEGLRKQVGDDFWLARAEAALALMRLKDPKLAATVKPMLSDSSAKARIAAMDALATAGLSAERAIADAAKNLDNDAWQVRSAAAECLGGAGSMLGVEALITRMTTEAGRVRRDCYDALKKITKDDLGLNPENWSKWWKRERERVGGGIPNAPKTGPTENPEDLRYARPERPYGLQVFSDRIGYCLDMSNSMFNFFDPDPEAVKKLRRKYTGATKFDISKEEIVQSIQALDQRARFNVMVFSTKPRFMSNSLVPAVPENHKKADGFLRSCRSTPDASATAGAPQLTSFYDAFRGVFDIPKGVTIPPPNFAETPDTMFFLTDGEPTAGEIIDADELLAWFNGLNRYARIRVHVVAYGNMGIDIPFLTHLAEDNGGKFINIAEAKGEAAGRVPPTTPK
jgi:hypothetical protein